MTTIVLFEDDAVAGFGPLTQTRPAFELRVGCFNLRERIALAAPAAALCARVRPHLVAPLRASGLGVDPEVPTDATPLVLLNARWDGSGLELGELLARPWTPGLVQKDGDRVVLAHAIAADLDHVLRDAVATESSSGHLLDHPWHAVQRNAARIGEDAAQIAAGATLRRILFGVDFEDDAPLLAHLAAHPFATFAGADGVGVVGPHPVLVGPGARLKPGVVLDASDGPIVIGAGCRIEPNAVVQGPAYLGPGCTVNPGAKLREGTALGAGCKVGGEVEESIVLDLSNKQHDGFLGHAYVGSWVNLGADTNASDLKNNYGSVRVDIAGTRFDSGERFVGPTIGDHAKTGINTMLSTGAVLGVAANVFGGGFPPPALPAFTWGGAEQLDEYDLKRALETAAVVMGRRRARFGAVHEALLRHVFAETASYRERVLRG